MPARSPIHVSTTAPLVALLLACGGGSSEETFAGTTDATPSTTESETTREPTTSNSDDDDNDDTGTNDAPDDTSEDTADLTTSTSATDESSTGEAMGQRVLLGVGYGGMRVRSLDDGVTWGDYTQLVASGGDDMALLRGCAWGNGRFVAGGWRIFSSEDAVTWQEHDNPTGQWFGAVAFGNDMFLGVGGGGLCARSNDGMTWESCTDVTDDGGFEHVRSTLFLDGLFYTADADGDVRTSPDGGVWTFDRNLGTPWIAIEDGAIVSRQESAPAEFTGLRLRGTIERAESGSKDFVSVFNAIDNNDVFQAFRFGFCEGFVPQAG